MDRYARGTRALGICDRCGFSYKLSALKTETVRGRRTSSLVCPECWDEDHPQNRLGEQVVHDPQALRNPRPDRSEYAEMREYIHPVTGFQVTTSVGAVTVSIS